MLSRSEATPGRMQMAAIVERFSRKKEKKKSGRWNKIFFSKQS
jgi:hypothetical protein